MKPIAAFFSITLLLLVLTACGQKGPLYLPEEAEDANENSPAESQQQPQPDQGSAQ